MRRIFLVVCILSVAACGTSSARKEKLVRAARQSGFANKASDEAKSEKPDLSALDSSYVERFQSDPSVATSDGPACFAKGAPLMGKIAENYKGEHKVTFTLADPTGYEDCTDNGGNLGQSVTGGQFTLASGAKAAAMRSVRGLIGTVTCKTSGVTFKGAHIVEVQVWVPSLFAATEPCKLVLRHREVYAADGRLLELIHAEVSTKP
jgi:hypothetical protein